MRERLLSVIKIKSALCLERPRYEPLREDRVQPKFLVGARYRHGRAIGCHSSALLVESSPKSWRTRFHYTILPSAGTGPLDANATSQSRWTPNKRQRRPDSKLREESREARKGWTLPGPRRTVKTRRNRSVLPHFLQHERSDHEYRGCPTFSHTLLEEWNTPKRGSAGYFTSTFMRIQGWIQH